jgi:VCBS repeat-containing protein
MPTNVVTVTTTSTSSLGLNLSWTTLYDAFANSSLQPGGTSTQFTIVENNTAPSPNYQFVVIGTGFTYSGNQLTGGTITGLEFLDPTNDLLTTFSGFDIGAVSLLDAINSYKMSGDTNASALNAVFLSTSGQEYDYVATGSPGIADTLQGGAVADTLVAGGPSTLIGGTGTETFVYTTGNGAVTIDNFAPSQGDKIDLTVTGVTTFGNIQSDAKVSNGNTVITFSSGQSLTLTGFTSALTSSDFNIIPLTISGTTTGTLEKDSTTSSITTDLSTADVNSGATVTWSLVGGTTPHAPDYSVAIDQFTVVNNGSTEFNDTFASSTPPDYTGTTTAAQYGVTSGATVVNSNHQDILEGSHAAVTSASATDPFLGQFVTLKTESATTAQELVQGTAFTVSAMFSLSLPAEDRNSYGIQLSDSSGAGTNDDIVRLQVFRTTGGVDEVTLNQINGVTGANTTLQSMTLSPSQSDDQIELQLAYNPANGNSTNVTASFELLESNGTVDSTQTFTDTGSIFDTVDWTQPQFFAQAPAESDSVVQGTYGTLDITQAGALTYTLNNSQANVEALTQGQSLTDSATVQATDNHGNTATTPVSVTIDGASPTVSVTIAGSGAPVAASYNQFLGFGDSNIDSGYFFNTPISNNSTTQGQYRDAVAAGGGLPTSLGGVMNSTLLAEDFGLNADSYNPNTHTSGSALGTNYAASGATVTGSLSGSLAPSITSQITTYLSSTGGVANPDALYLISGGGNDEKIAENLPGQQGENFMISEANALANALIELHTDGAQYIIIDNDSGAGTLGAIFNATLDSALGAAGVPFIDSNVKSLTQSIEADASAYGLLNVNAPPVGTSSNPYNPDNGGADLDPNNGEFAKAWALYATALVSPNAGETDLFADDEHLSAAGQQIEANYNYNLVQTDTPLVGETLTADPAVVNGAGSDFTYQWQSLGPGQTIWSNISDANSSTYQVQNTDEGTELRVAVSFTDADTGQTVSAFSAPTFDAAPCYCPGTLIRTERGETAVEQLKIGDRVMTRSGAARPIKWIGRRSYGGRFVASRKDILPVCIKAGALDDSVPRRDLWISPHHAMYLDGVLIEAKDLINGVSIVQAERVDKVEYFHLELDTHDVIIADGALSESFIDDDSRCMFHNAHEYRALYPNTQTGLVKYCAPRLDDGYEVEAARRRIKLRAGLLHAARGSRIGTLRGYVDLAGPSRIVGWAQNLDHSEAPVCLDIYVGGQLIGQTLANLYRDDLEQAGIGSGRHGFEFAPPAELVFAPQAVEVRRSLDGAALARSVAVAEVPRCRDIAAAAERQRA